MMLGCRLSIGHSFYTTLESLVSSKIAEILKFYCKNRFCLNFCFANVTLILRYLITPDISYKLMIFDQMKNQQ